MRARVDLPDRCHDALQERPVVGDDGKSACVTLKEVLEPLEAVEVEVVGGRLARYSARVSPAAASRSWAR